MSVLVMVFQNEADAIASEQIIANDKSLPEKAVNIDGVIIEGEMGATSWASISQRYSNPSEWWFIKPEDKYLTNVTASYQIMVRDESFYPPYPDDP